MLGQDNVKCREEGSSIEFTIGRITGEIAFENTEVKVSAMAHLNRIFPFYAFVLTTQCVILFAVLNLERKAIRQPSSCNQRGARIVSDFSRKPRVLRQLLEQLKYAPLYSASCNDGCDTNEVLTKWALRDIEGKKVGTELDLCAPRAPTRTER